MKRVLITGASSGIGAELATQYLQRGWHVIACGRDESRLVTALGSASEQLSFCIFDVANQQQTLTVLSECQALDCAILNAGTCEYIDSALAFDSTLFERVLHTNLVGIGYCLEAVIPNLVHGGQLALVSSTVTLLPLPRAEAYGASKAGLDYLAHTLAIDLAPHGIDVSLIQPGFVDTPLTKKNDFPMPGIISCERAAHAIIRGLHKRKAMIQFPTGFVLCMKMLRGLPRGVWRSIAVKLIRKHA